MLMLFIELFVIELFVIECFRCKFFICLVCFNCVGLLMYVICEDYGCNEIVFYIWLCGCWLGSFGFDIGVFLKVEVIYGSIIFMVVEWFVVVFLKIFRKL